MPSSDPAQRFEDILANIARIETHTAGIDDETAFEENHTAYDAVERCLERISEAAKKLGAEAETPLPLPSSDGSSFRQRVAIGVYAGFAS